MEHNRNKMDRKKTRGLEISPARSTSPFKLLKIENCCEIRSKGNSSEEERIHFLMQSAPATR